MVIVSLARDCSAIDEHQRHELISSHGGLDQLQIARARRHDKLQHTTTRLQSPVKPHLG